MENASVVNVYIYISYLHIHTLMCITDVVPSSVSCAVQISTVRTCSNIMQYQYLYRFVRMDMYVHGTVCTRLHIDITRKPHIFINQTKRQ